ncbi:MAG: hypothetical protein A2X94_10555 [Bdellovibrionales bacterium GWB1_55_8]|nr:MAG: hypothetical protein A2X94_10555 [Bdellovibrionales bacterium GWB1_55_8]
MIQTIAGIDFETTSVDVRTGQVIEGAVVLMSVENGNVTAEIETYSSMNDPGTPIPAEITMLTGITDEMVRGQCLDWQRFNAIVARADLIIAHNARFDRAWLETFGKYMTPKWGCTLSMIDWKKQHGMPCATLRHLAWEHGHFPTSHRALDDVRTMLHLLTMNSRGKPEETYLAQLLKTAQAGRRLVIAKGSPFDKKDALKAQQFSWSPARKTWWRLLAEDEWETLKPWLDQEIYSGRPSYETFPQVDFLAPSFRIQHGLE